MPISSNNLIERFRLDLLLSFNSFVYSIIEIDSLICFRVRYGQLMQILKVWYMQGRILWALYVVLIGTFGIRLIACFNTV